MSVELDPVELGFRRPFTNEVAETLHLKNPNSDPIAFKVKTTAPKQYCVRPNSGRIEAGAEVEVQVLLQAMREDPPEGTKCRDKFLVQSVKVAADQEYTNITDIWTNIEKSAKGSISEKKIRVSFLPADGTAATPARSTFANQDEEPPAYSSPASNMNTPAAIKTSDTKDIGETQGNGGAAATVSGSAAAAAGAVGASVASAVPSRDDAKAKLADAQAEIKRLTAQIQEQGLRQRKALAAGDGGSGGATATIQQVPAGVAVPIVAALCLLSFLLAYFLF